MLLSAALLLAASPDEPQPVAAHPDVITAPGVPVTFRVPVPIDAWERRPAGDDVIHVVRAGASPVEVHITADRSFQPDLSKVSIVEVTEALQATPEPGVSDVSASPRGDARLGPLVEGRLVYAAAGDAPPQTDRVAVFAVRNGLVTVTVSGAEGETSLYEVLGNLEVQMPPRPADELARGHTERPAGYTIDLQDGWRALTAQEMANVSTVPRGGGQTTYTVFADVTKLTAAPAFTCATTVSNRDPIPVFPPAKGPEYLSHHLKRVRGLVGNGVMLPIRAWRRGTTGADARQNGAVAAGDGEVSTLRVGDRDAWLWKNGVTVEGQAMRLAAVYMTWGETALDCLMVAPTDGAPEMTAFLAMAGSLRVHGAATNPVAYSIPERYKLWWPFRHPALQIYWLVLPLAAGALWLATRDD